MTKFRLKDSDEYYLALTEQPKRFDADSPVTNVFFDDTNGQVFTVRSGGVTGVTVNSMDETKCTSFRMEDRGPIISIKFSPDLKILAIQRNLDNQNATVEFVNFKDLAPTNVEYTHTCKWKNAKILGFVWPKINEIAFITDHGIELLQVLPEKKQLKSLKSTAFSCAWFAWCSQSNIVLLAGNNGVLLQPFSLNNSTIAKLQKLEVEPTKPVLERDVFILRLCDATWCAVFRHGHSASVSAPGPTEVWLMPIMGPNGFHYTHVLKTGLVGRFAVNVIDDLVLVHHQSSETSQLFDIMEDSKPENNMMIHIPVVPGVSMKPALVGDNFCPMSFSIEMNNRRVSNKEQTAFLYAYMREHPNLAKCFAGAGPLSRATYEKHWTFLTDKLNALGPHKEKLMWKKTWADMRYQLKKKKMRDRLFLTNSSTELQDDEPPPLDEQVITIITPVTVMDMDEVRNTEPTQSPETLRPTEQFYEVETDKPGALEDPPSSRNTPSPPLNNPQPSPKRAHTQKNSQKRGRRVRLVLKTMDSDTWVVFQPDYIIDARLGCLWRVNLLPSGLAHSIPKDEISKIVAVLLRRTHGKETIYKILNQLVTDAGTYLVELSSVFDEINSVYRKWADLEVARNTAGQAVETSRPPHNFRVLISQPDICSHVLQYHADDKYLVQVVTAYIASLCRHSMTVQQAAAEVTVRALVTRGATGRLRAALRRGALGDARPLACALLSLGHLDPAAAQLALDMMWRLKGYEEVVEVLLSWNEPVSAVGAARAAGAWGALAPRKLLAAAAQHATERGEPTAFTAIYHALQARNERVRGSPHFVKGEQCDSYVEYYKQITAEQ